jgi:hypothetical protein
VVIGKKKSNAPVAGASKALKKVPLIDLSDSKEVCGLIFVSKLFYLFSFFFFKYQHLPSNGIAISRTLLPL